MTSKNKSRLLGVFFFAWLIALLILTYWPDLEGGDAEKEGLRTDYIGHFGFYALLIIFFLLWHRFKRKNISNGYMLQAVLLGIALGAVTELTQQFVPGRSLNPIDMLFNCTGIVTGAFLFKVVGNKPEP